MTIDDDDDDPKCIYINMFIHFYCW